jgi:hypothetical protein
MSRPAYRPTQLSEIFDILESYLDFCRDYGHVYNEADVYNYKAFSWHQYQKFLDGKHVKNMWNDLIRGYAPRKPYTPNQPNQLTKPTVTKQ